MQSITCPCSHCGVNIEFDEDFKDLTMDCPQCQKPTRLYNPSTQVPPPTPPPVPQSPNLMACPDCGKQVSRRAPACPSCGVPILQPSGPFASRPPGAPPPVGYSFAPPKSRGVYIILGILLGTLGIHNFYAGRYQAGAAQILITLLLGWFILPLIGVIIWIIFELCTVKTDGSGYSMQ